MRLGGGAGPAVRKSGRPPDAAGRPRAARRCPRHREPAECEQLAAQVLADADRRNELVLDLEQLIWRRVSAELERRALEEFVTMFEVADGSRDGEVPEPSLERSVFLWHARLGDATLAERAAPVLVQRCPVEEELFRAQREALVFVAQNRGGIFVRDVLFERPDIRMRDDCPVRFAAFARPIDRFLVRMPVFRGAFLLDDIGVSRIVLQERHLPQIRELLRETGLTPSAPDWGWHIAAMWIAAAATLGGTRDALGARPGPSTRQ